MVKLCLYQNENINGIIKEYYDNGMLEFEDEYINGKRNGKGKEYWDIIKKVKFEGEYLNGKINGKGKKYDDSWRTKIRR